jgi:hypothetical protein
MLVDVSWLIELKRDGAFKRHPFCRNGMLQLQNSRVQQQAGRLSLDVEGSIQGIAQNRVTDGHHVQTQLVCAASDGLKFNARGIC